MISVPQLAIIVSSLAVLTSTTLQSTTGLLKTGAAAAAGVAEIVTTSSVPVPSSTPSVGVDDEAGAGGRVGRLALSLFLTCCRRSAASLGVLKYYNLYCFFYATARRDSVLPNAGWAERPEGCLKSHKGRVSPL